MDQNQHYQNPLIQGSLGSQNGSTTAPSLQSSQKKVIQPSVGFNPNQPAAILETSQQTVTMPDSINSTSIQQTPHAYDPSTVQAIPSPGPLPVESMPPQAQTQQFAAPAATAAQNVPPAVYPEAQSGVAAVNQYHLPITAASKKSSFEPIRRMLLTLFVAGGIVGGISSFRGIVQTFSSYILTNDGVTYSFTFFKDASQVTAQDGTNMYYTRGANSASVSVKPLQDATPPQSCDTVGSNWYEDFAVTIGGTQYPVCSDSANRYVVSFSENNESHIMDVTFLNSQSTSAYKNLKTIFSSVKVD